MRQAEAPVRGCSRTCGTGSRSGCSGSEQRCSCSSASGMRRRTGDAVAEQVQVRVGEVDDALAVRAGDPGASTFHSCGTVQSSTGVPVGTSCTSSGIRSPISSSVRAHTVAGDAAADREQLADQVVQLLPDLLDAGQFVGVGGRHLSAPTLASRPGRAVLPPLAQSGSLVRGNGRPPGGRFPPRDSHAGRRRRVSPQLRDSRGRRCADLCHGHLQPFRRRERQRLGRRHERRSLPHGPEADGQPRRRRDRLPGSRHLQREPPRQPRRSARRADPADQRSRRAGDARRTAVRPARLERRDRLGPRPRRSQRGQPAEPDGQRGPRHLRRQRRHRRPHEHLLLDRLARVGHGARRRPRRQPHPRLRTTAYGSTNHDHGIYVESARRHGDHQQRRLRQRRPRHPALPGRAGLDDRQQRDRRQRRGHHLLRRQRPGLERQRRPSAT